MSHDESGAKLGRWDFLGWRRRVVSDRTWFGMGLIAVGVGVPMDEGGTAWLLLPAAALGALLIYSGVTRAIQRGRDAGRDAPLPPL